MSASCKAVLILLLVPLMHQQVLVQSATIRDYVQSAAHMVGLDSIVPAASETSEDVTETAIPMSGEESSPGSTCCDLPQPPCAVDVKVEKVVPVVEPVPVAPCHQPCATPCPAPVPAPVPCPQPPCPIDLDSARAASHSRMWEVALKGKSVASSLTHALAAPVVFTNSKISSAASLLPDLMSAKGRLVGHMVSAPVQLLAGKSSLIATGASGLLVAPPVAIGTAIAAGVSGLWEAVNDLRRQRDECLCRQELENKVTVVKEEVLVPQVPCPCSTPGSVLIASGSQNEEKFTIDDPVTDSPVTESIGGSQADARESVTVADFTTTAATNDMSL